MASNVKKSYLLKVKVNVLMDTFPHFLCIALGEVIKDVMGMVVFVVLVVVLVVDVVSVKQRPFFK